MEPKEGIISEGEFDVIGVEADDKESEGDGGVGGASGGEKIREDSFAGGVVIEQTIIVQGNGHVVDKVLEGDVQAVDSVDEEGAGEKGVDKSQKGVKDKSGASIGGRREEGDWHHNTTFQGEPESVEEEEELLDRISLVLFSPTSSPITIAILAALFISSILGLACIYCRGKQRKPGSATTAALSEELFTQSSSAGSTFTCSSVIGPSLGRGHSTISSASEASRFRFIFHPVQWQSDQNLLFQLNRVNINDIRVGHQHGIGRGMYSTLYTLTEIKNLTRKV